MSRKERKRLKKLRQSKIRTGTSINMEHQFDMAMFTIQHRLTINHLQNSAIVKDLERQYLEKVGV